MVFVPIIPNENRKIRYTCGKCGREVEREDVLQCPICLVSMCDQCSNYTFCSDHFHALIDEDRRTVMENFHPKVNGDRNRIMVAITVGLLFLGVFALFLFRGDGLSVIDGPIFIFIVIGILIFVGIAVFFVNHRIKSGQNSRFGYIASQIAKNYTNYDEPENERRINLKRGINLKYCSKCGNLAEKSTYCTQCGEKLL
jgi:hypothetical protein